jgi:hypothetical protein
MTVITVSVNVILTSVFNYCVHVSHTSGDLFRNCIGIFKLLFNSAFHMFSVFI